MKFLDQAKIFIQSGHGGAGAVSFRREANIPRGGPDGGDGGAGGNVVAECVDNLNTLIDYRYRQHFKASHGGHGMGKTRNGKNGKDMLLKLPAGTEILTEDKTTCLADLTHIGQRVTLAAGGDGGRGNTHFKSATKQAPRQAEKGWPGQGMWIWLRLKLIADVGLIGLPNAGKSSFLAAVSAARPKIADYPFTTLHPQLGMVDRHGSAFVIADMPGLIKGAHSGVGLGQRFLQHMERCGLLLHLVDATAADPMGDWQTIRHELTKYADARLAQCPHITVLSKADACDATRLADLTQQAEKMTGGEVMAISSIARTGLEALLDSISQHILRRQTADKQPAAYDSLAETAYHNRSKSPDITTTGTAPSL